MSSSTDLSSVVLSNSLPANLRLAQAVSEFAQALDSPAKQKFRELQVQLSTAVPSAADVIKLTEELNREGTRRHGSWRPAEGTRAGGFLRRIQQYAACGDVLIGGSQNLIASGVWATVRTMLEASIGFHSLFDQVSTLLMRLSTSWYINQEFAQHFPASQELQTFLAEYLIRVVRLCHKILLFTKKSPATLLAASLFSSFDAEFLPLQQELDQWGLLIEKKFSSLVAKSTLDGQVAGAKLGRSITRLVSNKSKQRLRFDMQHRLLDRLSPDQDLFESIWRRERKRGNATWLLESAPYRAWKSDGQASVLQIKGCLGSGKTVALANVAADLTFDRESCAFFFCKSDDERTLTSRNILGSIARQLILNNMAHCHWDRLDQEQHLSLKPLTLESITELLQLILPIGPASHRVVIDGLENCPSHELQEVIEALVQLQGISICFSTRPDSEVASMLGGHLAITHRLQMNDPGRYKEMHAYIEAEVRRRNTLRDRPLKPEVLSAIVGQLTVGAQGMYLWVYLQLEAMLPVRPGVIVSNGDMSSILTRLPKNLPEAFDQALSRVSDRRYSRRIFELVAVAAVPLTGDQLKVAVSVTPGITKWDSRNIPSANPHLLIGSSCGSLLEVDEEDGRVRFIHHSVLSYFTESLPSHHVDSISLVEAETLMGSVCVTYLNYTVFDNRVTVQQKDLNANVVAEKVINVAVSERPALSLFIRHMKNDKHRTLVPKQFDLVSLLQQVQVKDDDTVKCFLPYCEKYWMHHTRLFNTKPLPGYDLVSIPAPTEYALWKDLIEGDSEQQIVKPPWEDVETDWRTMGDYAVANHHGALFQYVLRHKVIYGRHFDFINWLNGHILTPQFEIRGPWMDDILSLYLATGEPEPEGARRLIDLGAQGDFPLCPRRELLPNGKYLAPRVPPYLFWTVLRTLCKGGPIRQFRQVKDVFDNALRMLNKVQTLPVDPDFQLRDLLVDAISSGWAEGAQAIIRTPPWGLGHIDYSSEILDIALNRGQLSVVRTLLLNGEIPSVSYIRLARDRGRQAILSSLRSESGEPAVSGMNKAAWFSADSIPPHDITMGEYYIEAAHKDLLDCLAENLVEASDVIAIIEPDRAILREHIIPQKSKEIRQILGWIIKNWCCSALMWLQRVLPAERLRNIWIVAGLDVLQAALWHYSHGLDGPLKLHHNIVIEILVEITESLNLIDAPDSEGWTPLHYAINGHMVDAVNWLLKAGAKSDGSAHSNSFKVRTPLEVALIRSCPCDPVSQAALDVRFRIIELLIRHGPDKNPTCLAVSPMSVLHFAIAMQSMVFIERLVRDGADFSFGQDANDAINGSGIPADAEKWLETILLLECAAACSGRASHLLDRLKQWEFPACVSTYVHVWRHGVAYLWLKETTNAGTESQMGPGAWI